MFHYIKTILIRLGRDLTSSIINVIGLTACFVVCILIMMWTSDELSYDKFHKNSGEIYRVLTEMQAGELWYVAPAPLGLLAKEEIPEVENACRTRRYRTEFNYNSSKTKQLEGLAVDTSFFSMFSFTLLQGDVNNPLPDNLSVILTEKQAKIMFGDEDPIGQSIVSSDDLHFHVTGIIKDIPKNSSIQANYILRFDALDFTFRGNGIFSTIDIDWGTYGYITYFMINDKSDLDVVTQKLGDAVNETLSQIGLKDKKEYRLQPLEKIHLYTLDGQYAGMKRVFLFSVIAVLILIITCINCANLLTVRLQQGIKDISVRRILGAEKASLLKLYYSEILFLLLLSFIISVFLIYSILPFFNNITEKSFTFSLLDLNTLAICLLIFVASFVLSSIYLTYSILKLEPVESFRIKRTREKTLLRKVLLTVQFGFAIGLIFMSIVTNLQLRYIRNLDLGYNKENILYTGKINDLRTRYSTIRERLLKEPGIIDISTSDLFQMQTTNQRKDMWKDEATGEFLTTFEVYFDTSFFSFMDIQIVEGRNFIPKDQVNHTWENGFIVNEAAAQIMGKGESVVGLRLINKSNVEIIGVAKNFNFENANEPIKPMFIAYLEEGSPANLYVKIDPKKTEEAILAIEEIWKEYNGDSEFVYGFLGEDFKNQYRAEINSNTIITIFSIIAIIISCLGVFGITTYTVRVRSREVAVRKIFGANLKDITQTFLKDFLIVFVIATVIALPLAYYFSSKILQEFVFRISIPLWVPIISVIISLLILILTIGYKIYRAARANPIEYIKIE